MARLAAPGPPARLNVRVKATTHEKPWRSLRRSRLTALSLDIQSGGAGAGSVELFGFVIDLARADPIAPVRDTTHRRR